MTEQRCTNCGNPEAETYELTVRSEGDGDVPLCDECYEALEQEFIWSQ